MVCTAFASVDSWLPRAALRLQAALQLAAETADELMAQVASDAVIAEACAAASPVAGRVR